MPDQEDVTSKYRAPALEKGLDVLELLAAHGTPMSMVQISTALQRSVSELFRMVQVLEQRGYVANSLAGDGLSLTNKLFSLGITQGPTKSVIEAALPIMRSLSDRIGQSCHLAVASGIDMVVIARVEAPGNQGYSVRVGYRRPIVQATSGLVLYAFQPERIRSEWQHLLQDTISQSNWSEFERKAAKARKERHVQALSDVTKHVRDLSAPILGPDGVAAALTSPYIETPTAIAIGETLEAITAAALEVSIELGGAF